MHKLMMIMSDKTQCQSCQFYGTVRGFENVCCKAFDENGNIVFANRARKSNCWCLDWTPNGKDFTMQPFHVVGKYLTERYGTSIALMPVLESDNKKNASVVGFTEFKVKVQSRRLKADYSAKFSIAGKQNMKSFRDVFEELIREEVE